METVVGEATSEVTVAVSFNLKLWFCNECMRFSLKFASNVHWVSLQLVVFGSSLWKTVLFIDMSHSIV